MSHILASLLLAAVLAVGASTAGAAASTGPSSGTAVAQQEPQHAAAVVIDTGQEVKRVCVRFPEASITGEELLRRANVQAVFSHDSMGAAVCALCGVGCPSSDCFCESYTSGRYWNYSIAEGPGWQRSHRGASSRTVTHGDVDGWAWGTGGATPPYAAFDTICEEVAAAPAPSPTASPTPTSSPSPRSQGGTSTEDPSPQPAAPGPAPAPAPAPAPPPSPSDEPAAATGPSAERDVAAAPAPATAPTAEPAPTPSPTADDPAPTADPDPTATADPSPGPEEDGEEAAPLEVSHEPTGGMAGQLVLFGVLASGLTGALLWHRRRGPAPPT